MTANIHLHTKIICVSTLIKPLLEKIKLSNNSRQLSGYKFMVGHRIKQLYSVISYEKLKAVVNRVSWGRDIINLLSTEMNE